MVGVCNMITTLCDKLTTTNIDKYVVYKLLTHLCLTVCLTKTFNLFHKLYSQISQKLNCGFQNQTRVEYFSFLLVLTPCDMDTKKVSHLL